MRGKKLSLIAAIKKHLSKYDVKIAEIEIKHGSNRKGDIPHSLASVDKAKEILGYNPSHKIEDGIKEAIAWYWNNLM